MPEIVSVTIHPAIGMDRLGNSPDGIVNLDGCGMLVVSLARRLGSENPLLAYCAAPLQPTNTPGSRGRTRPAGHSHPLYRWRTSGLTALPGRLCGWCRHRAAPRRQSGGTLGAPNATLLDPGTFGKAGSSNPKGYYMLFAVKNDGVSALKTQ